MSRFTSHTPRGLLLLVLAVGACQTAAPAATVTAPAAATRTPSATSIPSPSPVPPTTTATPAPAPRLFTEDFEQDVSNWSFLQAATGGVAPSPVITGSLLRLDMPYPNQWLYEIYAPHTYTDVRIDAHVDLGTGGPGAAGVICRYDQGAGWYEFNIYADRTYTLLFGQWLAEGIARYMPLVVAQSEEITPSVNEIGLACQDDILTPYINGVQLRRRQETLHVLNEGAVGISAASFETAPLVMLFDWITVTEP